jgi:hypothetical protein
VDRHNLPRAVLEIPPQLRQPKGATAVLGHLLRHITVLAVVAVHRLSAQTEQQPTAATVAMARHLPLAAAASLMLAVAVAAHIAPELPEQAAQAVAEPDRLTVLMLRQARQTPAAVVAAEAQIRQQPFLAQAAPAAPAS